MSRLELGDLADQGEPGIVHPLYVERIAVGAIAGRPYHGDAVARRI
jgi:hypothetical protein